MMYNPNYYDWSTPTGWRCPTCGRIYSPTTFMCPYCGNKEITVQTTGTSIDDSGWWQQYLEHTTADSDVNINFNKDGSISRIGPMPEVKLENMNWRDWLDTTREQIRKEANLK